MTILRSIQEEAVDSEVKLSSLLRRCKILAARLGNNDFKNWVDSELNGYNTERDVPEYRILNVNSKGHFAGPFQSGLRNADIPLMSIPKDFRDGLQKSYLMEPIAALESLAEDATEASVQEPWNPDLVAFVGREIYQNYNCMQAWKVIPINAIVATLDTVRTRVLNFVLEIEAENPNAGEGYTDTDPVRQEKVSQIFNTYITGNVGNIASGGSNFTQEASFISENNELFEKILSALSNSTADRDVVARLSATVEEMRDAEDSDRFRDLYGHFMSQLADHIQVLGPVLAPYLQPLTAMLS